MIFNVDSFYISLMGTGLSTLNESASALSDLYYYIVLNLVTDPFFVSCNFMCHFKKLYKKRLGSANRN